MNNKIKTGILSFGMSGKIFHAPFLHKHAGFQLSAVVERTEKKAPLIYPAIKSFHSVDELLADAEIELVVVNTPNATHYNFAMLALRAGKHVLVEKPFTISSKDAVALYKEARQQNRLILPYQNRRYDSDFLAVQQVIDSGKLGKLVEVHMRFDRYRYNIGPKVAKETPVPGSGLLWDLGPHLVDAAILIFGKPVSWIKNKGLFRPDTRVDDYAHIHLLYPGGLQVFITVSMLVAEAQPAFIINGTRGSFIKYRTNIQEQQLLEGLLPSNPLYGIETTDKYAVLTTIGNDGAKTREKIASVKSTYMNAFEDIFQTIRTGKDYPVTEDQIIQQLEILEE